MTFLQARTAEANRLFLNSVARTVKVGEQELRLAPFTGDDGLIGLWWGPLVPVHRGDLLRHFLTPTGIAIEGVEPAPPVTIGDTLSLPAP